MRARNQEEHADVIEELSILVETGLPSIEKVKIYQSGIRSRAAANELGDLMADSLLNQSIFVIKKELIRNANSYLPKVTETTAEWVEMLQRCSSRASTKISIIESFKFGDTHKKTDTLIAKIIGGRKYLLSPDLRFTYEGWGDVDFTPVIDLPGIEFVYNNKTKHWEMINNNPYLEAEENE
jgi:hypothetical protein